MKNLLIFLLFATMSTVYSCKKDTSRFRKISAMVVYESGDPAATGCGYTIKINDSTSYYPINLSDTYKKDQLKIMVDYHLLTTKHHCGLIPSTSNALQEINIDAISAN